jgi:hypothetical protein
MLQRMAVSGRPGTEENQAKKRLIRSVSSLNAQRSVIFPSFMW